MYTEHQVQTLSKVRNKEVVAGGGGRCDSPGHSMKYRTYSVEVKNSNGMELEGLKRCLDHLQEENVTIAKLATDRHIQVRAHLKKERPNIKYNFDVWHMAKSVKKKSAKTPRQSHALLSNHGFMPS